MNNEGRSMSFYCRACALLPPDLIRQAIGEMEGRQTDADLKAAAKGMRALLQNLATQAGISLKLRK